MKSVAALLLLVLSIDLWLPSTQARTATNAERAACESKIQGKIDAIDSRMRQPYTTDEGERLRERRRKLEEARANCRTKV
jgi:hypothetical protein